MPDRLTMDGLLRRMKKDARVQLHAPASLEGIRRAQSVLGVVLPKDYVAFVRAAGWAKLGSNIVHGLGRDAKDGGTNMVQATQGARESPLGWPLWHVVIMDVGNGDYYCLATERMKRGLCPVLTWYHELNEREEVAKDFVHWLDATYRDRDFVPP